MEELQGLLNQAERQKVKDILTVELRKLGTEVVRKEEALNKKDESIHTEKVNAAVTRQSTVLPTIQEKTYGNSNFSLLNPFNTTDLFSSVQM